MRISKIKLFLCGVVLGLSSCVYVALAADTALPQVAAEKTAAPAAVVAPTPAPLPTPVIPQVIPAAPDFDSKGYILIDPNSGVVLAEKNADTHLAPASLTKVMTLYLAADALQKKHISLTDMVPISEEAWRMGGSRMFIRVGARIPVDELLDGIIVASGNDAAYAMAEFIGGNEPSFVKAMNQKALELGMKNTNFVDSNGLPAPNHYSSPRDLANLSGAMIEDFPDFYARFKKQWITFNGIKQPNRNRLLWRDPTVDGMKTGHTDDAGYCLITSAYRNGMRLIAVLMGTPSDKARFAAAEALLNYGYRYYETHKLVDANVALTKQRVWFGADSYLGLGVKRDLYVTTPIGQNKNLKASIKLDQQLNAPIIKGAVVGKIEITSDGKLVSSQQLVALQDIPCGNILQRLFDHIVRIF